MKIIYNLIILASLAVLFELIFNKEQRSSDSTDYVVDKFGA